MTDIYLAGEAALWVQPDGPNTKPEFLGCHQMGDLTNPLGEMTVRFCPDPASHGKFKAATWFQGEPGVITTSLTTYIGSTADWLGKIARRRCPFPLYVFKGNCGRRDVFYAWERGFGLNPAVMTQRLLSNLAAREPSDEGVSEQAFDISAMEFHEWFDLTVVRQSIAETTDLTSIWTCSVEQCSGTCGDAKKPCHDMIIGSDAPAGSPAAAGDVWYTTDQGDDWNLSLMDPFAGGDEVQSVVCFPVDATTMRWLVARGGGFADIRVAYSDDGGATWTVVIIDPFFGSVQGPRALFSLDVHHIWLVTSGGHIYFSSDGGITWAEQEDGTLVGPSALNAVWFSNNLIGVTVSDGGDVLYTADGGLTWNVGISPTVTTMFHVTENAGGGIWWLSAAGGPYYSTDDGRTWARRSGWPGDGARQVRAMMFANKLTGFMVVTAWSPKVEGNILQTVNGGYSWKALETPSNDGLYDITVGDENTAFAIGKVSGGTGVVVKISE